MTWLTVFVALLTLGAIARITRLITEDAITAPLRGAIDRRAQPRTLPCADTEGAPVEPAPLFWRGLSTWTHCAWCSSLWVAAGASVAHYYFHDTSWFVYVVGAFSASQVVALAADWLDSPPPTKVHAIAPLNIHLTTDNGTTTFTSNTP